MKEDNNKKDKEDPDKDAPVPIQKPPARGKQFTGRGVEKRGGVK